MGDAIQKPFSKMAINKIRKMNTFVEVYIAIELYGTFVVSWSITFEKELFAVECQSLAD